MRDNEGSLIAARADRYYYSVSVFSYYNITNSCNRSLITVITLITRLENVMRDNEGSLIAARADRYYYSVSVIILQYHKQL